MSVDFTLKLFVNKLRTNSTKKYKMFLCAFFTLMLTFGTSKLWLPSDVKIMNTEYGTEKNTSSNISLKLRSWEYSKLNRYMEVTFDVKNNEDIQSLKFIPVAHTNTEKRKNMNASSVLSDGNTLVVQIKDVPQNWEVISLWIHDNMTVESNESNLIGANFYCDIRKVVINNSLKPKTQLGYQIQSIQNQISDVNAQIADLENQIEKENTEIDQLNFDITVLKENQKYQTKDEIDKSNSVINSKQTEIDTHKNNILKFQEQIKEYNIKLQKLSLKMKDTQNGKGSISTTPETSSSPSKKSSSSEAVTVD